MLGTHCTLGGAVIRLAFLHAVFLSIEGVNATEEECKAITLVDDVA